MLRAGARGDGADLQRGDERVPAGLQLDHARGSRRRRAARRWTGPSPSSTAWPSTVRRVMSGDGPQDAQCRPEADAFDVVEQRLQRQRHHRVADVDRDRDAVVDVQRRPAAAQQRLVLDVVVDEEGVVVELERRGGRQHGVEVTAEPEARGDAQRGPQRLPAAQGVVEDEVEQPGGRGRRRVRRAAGSPRAHASWHSAEVAVEVECVVAALGGLRTAHVWKTTTPRASLTRVAKRMRTASWIWPVRVLADDLQARGDADGDVDRFLAGGGCRRGALGECPAACPSMIINLRFFCRRVDHVVQLCSPGTPS